MNNQKLFELYLTEVNGYPKFRKRTDWSWLIYLSSISLPFILFKIFLELNLAYWGSK